MKAKLISAALAALLLASLLSGCGMQYSRTNVIKLDPSNPVSLTVWHYYNGAQQAAFDQLVDEFNSGVGREKGIYVEGYSQGSLVDLENAVHAALTSAPGAQPAPDIFSSYADTAYTLQKQGLLADISPYFSNEELAEYREGYIKEGDFFGDGSLYLFPVAKSTELLMLNLTAWTPFAEVTGVSTDDLYTAEGLTEVARQYYEWTDAQTPDIPDDGKAFYGRDSMSNYIIIGMKQMGIDIFDVSDGEFVLRADKAAMRRLWDNFYVPYIKGYFASYGKFRSDDVKTGDIIAYTGSTSSSMYFPSEVILDSGAVPIEHLLLPSPVMAGGDSFRVQQGASMAVIKSSTLHEYAACEFLKWFTAAENNLRFVCDSSYFPVRKDANSVEAFDAVIEAYDIAVNPITYDCITSLIPRYATTSYYTPTAFENASSARRVLDRLLSDKAAADKAAIAAALADGVPREEAIAPYLSDEVFEHWYTDFCAAVKQAARG